MLKRIAPLLTSASWKRLPARERLMFTLLLYEKLTPTETARAIGCSVREVVRTVASRLESLSRAPRIAILRPARARKARAAEPRRRAA